MHVLTLLGLFTPDVTLLDVDSPQRVQGRPAASPVSTSIIPIQLPTPLDTPFNQFLSSSIVSSEGTFTG